MTYADVENGPSPKDIPWYAHYKTWDELYKAEFEDDPSAMESGQAFRYEVMTQAGGPHEYRKMLIDQIADSLTEYEAGTALPFDVINPDHDERSWTKADRDEQIWDTVMTYAYFMWIWTHSDQFDPVMAELMPPEEHPRDIETMRKDSEYMMLDAFKRIGQVRLEKYSDK